MEGQNDNCVMCRRIIRNNHHNYLRYHVLTDDLPQMRPEFAEYIQENALLEVNFNNMQLVCHRCWQRVDTVVRLVAAEAVAARDVEEAQEHVAEEELADIAEVAVPTLHIPQYTRISNTARRCIFINCQHETRLRIPETIKKFVLSQFTDMLDILRRSACQGTRLNFEARGALNNADMHFWTGFNGDQFSLILEQTPSLNERCNHPRTALAIYLIKLRTGEPDDRLATLFNISRRTIERRLAIVRECLLNEFSVRYLGITHINRDNVLQRNLSIPKGIFGNEENNKAIVICDGTYIYIQKSSNFLFQKQTYSLHKYTNLLKPFLIVCTDGYIIDVLGPYAATTSDATIMTSLLYDEQNDFSRFLVERDVFILDRGFRDCLIHLDACGYEAHIPPSKAKNQTQLTTTQANKSRLVTICRWVVEVVNGRLKRDFKLFRQEYFNKSLSNMFVDFKIAASLINCFHRPIVDSRQSDHILRLIREKRNSPNLLFAYVEGKNLNRQRVPFERMDGNMPQLQDFPQLDEDDVKLFALGSYAVKLAKSYCGEHLQNGLYIIEVYTDNELNDLGEYIPLKHINDIIHLHNVWLLRGRIKSRHVRAKTYYCYLLIDRNQAGKDAISQHYCMCLTGRRTVGSCAHIVSLVWYLGFGRHHLFNAPANYLNNIIVDEEV